MYAQLFNKIFESKDLSRFAPFEFYIDLTSGTRNNVELFRRLGLPILSFSRNPHDRHTIPIPDLHLIAGLYNDSLNWSLFGLQSFAGGKQCSPYLSCGMVHMTFLYSTS